MRRSFLLFRLTRDVKKGRIGEGRRGESLVSTEEKSSALPLQESMSATQ